MMNVFDTLIQDLQRASEQDCFAGHFTLVATTEAVKLLPYLLVKSQLIIIWECIDFHLWMPGLSIYSAVLL